MTILCKEFVGSFVMDTLGELLCASIIQFSHTSENLYVFHSVAIGSGAPLKFMRLLIFQNSI